MKDQEPNIGISPGEQDEIKKIKLRLALGLPADASEAQLEIALNLARTKLQAELAADFALQAELGVKPNFREEVQTYILAGRSRESAEMEAMVDMLMEERYEK